MKTDLYTLAYFSRNVIEGGNGDVFGEIADILTASRRNNRRKRITGALLYSDNCFAQVLEGPLNGIESIFEDIECDLRHTDITILYYKPLEVRSFIDWSMAFAPLSATAGFDISGIIDRPSIIVREKVGQKLIVTLLQLISKHDADLKND